MTKTELKDIVKRYFNLTETEDVTETPVESFAEARLIDGTKVKNEKDSAFAVGDDLFVETEDGETVQAPTGEHELESGIVVTVDEEGKITGIKRPGEEGEGSLESSEEEMSETPAEKTELEDDEKKMEEPSEEIIEAIAEIVMPEIEAMKEKMADYETKMKEYEDKMKEYMSETPASDSKTAARFSKQSTSIKNSEGPKYNKRRYEMTLAKLTNHKTN